MRARDIVPALLTLVVIALTFCDLHISYRTIVVVFLCVLITTIVSYHKFHLRR